MTIKEALECLEKNSEMFDEIALENKTSYKDGTVIEAYLFHFNQNHIEQALKQAEKDLEVLTHLKLLFNGYNILKKMGISYKDMYLLCKNSDDDLIKEWLENE